MVRLSFDHRADGGTSVESVTSGLAAHHRDLRGGGSDGGQECSRCVGHGIVPGGFDLADAAAGGDRVSVAENLAAPADEVGQQSPLER